MIQTLSEMYTEHETIHYPELFKYVVLIAHEDEETGEESIGGGVLVAWEGRHLIVTAAHVIRKNPRVIREGNFYQLVNTRLATSPPVRILGKRLHDDFDIGYLEVNEKLGVELGRDQLHCGSVQSGALHVIGYPVCRITTNERLSEKTMFKSVFTSEITEQTDDAIRMPYPEVGYKVEDDQWVPGPYIERPHGFSGGGAFGITSAIDELRVIGYKLIGIQSCWDRVERWVEVVPIKHFVEAMQTGS